MSTRSSSGWPSSACTIALPMPLPRCPGQTMTSEMRANSVRSPEARANPTCCPSISAMAQTEFAKARRLISSVRWLPQ